MDEVKKYFGTYKPDSDKYYKISRSKIESYINCKRCFYLDRRLKISHPPGFPFNLNSAVDNLLKNEFDYYRDKKQKHPYIEQIGLNAIPFQHENLDEWRENFKGVSYNHPEFKFHLFGAVDDLWINLDTQELIVVDYKSTSKKDEVTLDAEWQDGYKRQMDFYQYLLRKNGFKVSNEGYFVYCNGIKEGKFNDKLNFNVKLIKYIGNDSWVEDTLSEVHKLLNQDNIPPLDEKCDFCSYQTKLKGVNEDTQTQDEINYQFCSICGDQKILQLDGHCLDCGNKLI